MFSLRACLLSFVALHSMAACGSRVPTLLPSPSVRGRTGVSHPPTTRPAPPVPESLLAQRKAPASDPEEVGRWLLGEMFTPGGSSQEARRARTLLDGKEGQGVYAPFACAVYDQAHGKLKQAASWYLTALQGVSTSSSPDTDRLRLFGWYAAVQVRHLQELLRGFSPEVDQTLKAILESPGSMGWHAVSELEHARAESSFVYGPLGRSVRDPSLMATRMGCAPNVRIAGPFGLALSADRTHTFAAENGDAWPAAWPTEPSLDTARVLSMEQNGCTASVKEIVPQGFFYAEVVFSLQEEQELLIPVEGAVGMRIDNMQVFQRPRSSWEPPWEEAVSVRLGKGSHRLVAKMSQARTSVRLLHADGRPAAVQFETHYTPPARNAPPPQPVQSPALFASFFHDVPKITPVEAALSAPLLQQIGLSDVASLLMEPWQGKAATGMALHAAALALEGDPALSPERQEGLARSFFQRAAQQDPSLWYPRFQVLLPLLRKAGEVDQVHALEALSEEFPEVSTLLAETVDLYGRLRWWAEERQALALLVKRFPQYREAVTRYAQVLEKNGNTDNADSLARRLVAQNPGDSILLDRSLARQDWAAARQEVKRFRPLLSDPTARALQEATLSIQSGNSAEGSRAMERVLQGLPQDTLLRNRVADNAYAKGDRKALRKAREAARTLDASEQGLLPGVDLVEGAGPLESYRVDGVNVIREFEAWQADPGHTFEGDSVRVLDFSVGQVYPNGASDMLEHTILRIQTQEGVEEHTEQSFAGKSVLRCRVLKADGRIVLPVLLVGKPSFTLPHLEVGDYVEIETLSHLGAPSQGKRHAAGPDWFFAEPGKGFWRSELVLLTPRGKPLETEVIGPVVASAPRVVGDFVEQRWRVDVSKPVPEEAGMPPGFEHIPQMHSGWGMGLPDLLPHFFDALGGRPSLDPRFAKQASAMVQSIPKADQLAQSQAVYRWVMENMEPDASPLDARRILMDKKGSRSAAFVYLLGCLGIRADYALVQSRLASPPAQGFFTERSRWSNLLVRVRTEQGTPWMTLEETGAPYGYIPPALRDQPARLLLENEVLRDQSPKTQIVDESTLHGTAHVAPDGSANLHLVARFSGEMAIRVRNMLAPLSPPKRREFLETNLLEWRLPESKLQSFVLSGLSPEERTTDFLTISMQVHAPSFLKKEATGFVLTPKGFPSLAGSIPQPLPQGRQSPFVLSLPLTSLFNLKIVLPKKVRPVRTPTQTLVKEGIFSVSLEDTFAQGVFVLHRTVVLPPCRVEAKEYPRLSTFAQRGDTLLEQSILFQ